MTSFGFFLLLLWTVSTISTQPVPSTGEGPLALEWPWVSPASVEDDYEEVSYPQSPGAGGDVVPWSLASSAPSTGRNYTIHVGSLSSGLPSSFGFQLPEGGG